MPVSLGLHLLMVALLIFGLPRVLQKPQDEQAVNVDLVPPPEPKIDPPTAQAKAEEPEARKAETPPAANAAPATQSPAPSFNPVFQYGEKDSGPEKSLEGNSAAEELAPPAEQPSPDEQAPTEKDTPATDNAQAELSLPDIAAIPTARPAEVAKAPDVRGIEKAEKLFSPAATGDPLATTGMGDLPRSVRGGTLCVTELREQLLRNAPPYFADLLPSSPLGSGTVIDVPGVAFRANGQWRELSYRCEVDKDATKVVSFAFQIGDLVPRSEWKQHGFPSR